MTLEQLVIQLNKNISDLCERISKIEQRIEDTAKSEKRKRETIYILIAGASSIIAIYQSIQ